MRKGLALFISILAHILQLVCLFVILKDNDVVLSVTIVVLYFISFVVGRIASNIWSNEALRPLIDEIDVIYKDIESQNKKILEEIENLKKGAELTVDG